MAVLWTDLKTVVSQYCVGNYYSIECKQICPCSGIAWEHWPDTHQLNYMDQWTTYTKIGVTCVDNGQEF